MERDEYKQRWLEVCKRMLVLKGATYTAGYFIGFIASLGRTDYRIVRKLSELERDLNIK